MLPDPAARKSRTLADLKWFLVLGLNAALGILLHAETTTSTFPSYNSLNFLFLAGHLSAELLTKHLLSGQL